MGVGDDRSGCGRGVPGCRCSPCSLGFGERFLVPADEGGAEYRLEQSRAALAKQERLLLSDQMKLDDAQHRVATIAPGALLASMISLA